MALEHHLEKSHPAVFCKNLVQVDLTKRTVEFEENTTTLYHFSLKLLDVAAIFFYESLIK